VQWELKPREKLNYLKIRMENGLSEKYDLRLKKISK
jgi:hypothetical protein